MEKKEQLQERRPISGAHNNDRCQVCHRSAHRRNDSSLIHGHAFEGSESK